MLTGAIFIDVVSIVVSLAIALTLCKPRHSHPYIAYLVFHVLFFSIRLLAIAGGDPTMFSSWGPGYEPISMEEISHAAMLADVGLLALTLGCAWASRRSQSGRHDLPRDYEVQTLSAAHVLRVCLLTLPIGLVAFVYLTRNPFVEFQLRSDGESQLSSSVTTLQTWLGLSLIALVYVYGFQKKFTIPLLLYLGIMMIQGYHRFRIIIPVIFLIQVWLDRSNRKWPSLPVVGLLFALFLVSVPLKGVGRMIQRGESMDSVASFMQDEIANIFVSRDTNQEFFDQFACSVALADEKEYMAFGGTYLPLLTLPVPRAFWPEKPGLADHLRDISTTRRPMFRSGMITTLMGESYINFGFLGVVVVPVLIGYLLTRLYTSAYKNSYFTVVRFSYVVLSCNLLLVYRDGLSSLILFTLLNMMPLCLIIAMHWLRPYSEIKPYAEWSGSMMFSEV